MTVIRQLTLEDTPAFLELQHALDRETQFMLLEPDERSTDVEALRTRLDGLLNQANSSVWVAEEAGMLVGYVSADGGRYRRNQHSAHLVMGIRQAYVGQGLGTRLLTALDTWARGVGLHRLELTVMAHNQAAQALYRKLGFVEEGTRHHAIVLDGAYIDELYMGKILI